MRHFILGLAALGTALVAHAVEHEDVSAKIYYSKHLLETDQGAEQVLEQLTETLRATCQIEAPDRQKVWRRYDHNCFDQMLADAVAKIDSPKLTAVFLARKSSSG